MRKDFEHEIAGYFGKKSMVMASRNYDSLQMMTYDYKKEYNYLFSAVIENKMSSRFKFKGKIKLINSK